MGFIEFILTIILIGDDVKFGEKKLPEKRRE